MRREHFEHVIAAAADVSGEREIVVIGSQAILGNVERPPESMLFSMEVDVFPRNDPTKAIDIEGALGEGSHFQSTFGYYAHGVGPETVVGPGGWEKRLVKVGIPARPGRSEGAIAYCLETHDLVLAKCVAGRDRDWQFAQDALDAGLVQTDELLRRVPEIPEPPADRAGVQKMLEGISARVRKGNAN
jgi:hypothetical protein